MNLYFSRINLQLPQGVIAEANRHLAADTTVQLNFKPLHIQYIDKLVEIHHRVLSNRYGLYTTSTLFGNNSVIHKDARKSAVNFALLGCGPGADTVFFNPVSSEPNYINIKSGKTPLTYIIDPTVEVDRATLTMGDCMLIDTRTLHVVRNSTYNNRAVLSIDCKVSYQEAYEYFADLGLIEVDILDRDRPIF